ncbi:cysteine desulfurase family protein [Paenibacillus sp. FSL H7-0690]|jgi:cysteine desulfurase|uniref:cysteine desulfurase family protein n=1 Tax=Paenibacillus sp. FSL H7-0690 TaxID=2921437 RepID=UPI0030EE4831
MDKIYFDYCASTPLHPEVCETFCHFTKNVYANPSSVHKMGFEASELVEESKKKIAKNLRVKPNEIVFTSGATESNNLAILGVVRANKKNSKVVPHIILSAIEHSSVFNCCKELEKENVEITVIPVDINGIVSVEKIKESIKDNTILVSVMHVNNETGAIQPIEEIGKIIKSRDHIYFHVDGVQALGKINIELDNIDLFTISGHKIGAPKGIGALIIKDKTVISPIIYGGNQEYGIRSGTLNVPGIVSLTHAIEIATSEQQLRVKYLNELHNYIYSRLLAIPQLTVNSPDSYCAPHILNFSHKGVPSAILINMLSQKGIVVSSQSACSSQSNKISRVLMAMTNDQDISSSSVRLSFHELTKINDLNILIEAIYEMVNQIRLKGKFSFASV